MSEPGVARLRGALADVVAAPSLPEMLPQIVRSSCDLAGARYGALAVTGPGHTASELIEVGTAEVDSAWISRVRDHPIDPPTRALLAVPIRVRGTVFGTLYLAQKQDADEFSEQDEELATTLAVAAGVAIENVTQIAHSQRRQQWLEASNHVTSALLAGQDHIATLHLIAEHARVVAGASVGGIARPSDSDSTQLVFEVVEPQGEDTRRLTGLSVPVEGSATGVAFSTGQSVMVRQYGNHVVVQQKDRTGSLPAMVKDLDSAVAIPLIVSEQPIGVLMVAKFRDKVPFTDAEVELAQTFAGHAALAVEFARAEANRRRLAVFEDRERIAHDLHDLVIQRLFATGLGLEGLSRLITDRDVSARVTGFVRELDRTIRDVRTSIFSLQEPAETRGSLRSELLGVALDAAGMLGFEPRIGFEGPLDSAVPDAVRPDLVATLHEGLANVARHAAATSVSVEVAVDRDGRQLSLVVTDDGVGIPHEPSRRSGLANLDDRAAHSGGKFSVCPAAGRGTKLEWTVPLR